MTREEIEDLKIRVDSITMDELCRLALVGLDAEAVAAAYADFPDALHADAVDAPSYAKGFLRGAEDMRERAAKWHDDEAVRLQSDQNQFGAKRIPNEWILHHKSDADAIRSLPIEGEGK